MENPKGIFGGVSVLWDRLKDSMRASPALFFVGLAFVSFATLFYTADLRQSVESYFYDTRIRWMPQLDDVDDIVLVEADEKTQKEISGQDAAHLNSDSLIRVAGTLATSEAKVIGFFMLPTFVNYEDPKIEILKDIIRYDQRIVVGILGYNSMQATIQSLPPSLLDISHRIFGLETGKKRSNSILRELPFTHFRGMSQMPSFPYQVATMTTNVFGDADATYRLRHIRESRFKRIKASDLVNEPFRYVEQLKDKVVLFSDVQRSILNYQTAEQTLINTPLKGDENTFYRGTHILYVAATAIENLIHHSSLSAVSPFINVFQIILLTIVFGTIWRFGTFIASFGIILIWCSLIMVHALLYSISGLDIPLADAALFSTFSMFIGLLNRLDIELSTRASVEAEAISKKELSDVQSQFFDQFADFSEGQTRHLLEAMKEIRVNEAENERDQDSIRRLRASIEDFYDYIGGIHNLSQLESSFDKSNRKIPVDLKELALKVLNRFESKLQKKSMRVVTRFEDCGPVVTNPQVVDSILFNFISNAINYSPSGSQVELRVETTRFGAQRRERVKISVKDQGVGIPEEYRNKIFERFYRIKNEQMFGVKGTGLGLYLSKFFAEKIGADIDLDSREGIGSEFSLIL